MDGCAEGDTKWYADEDLLMVSAADLASEMHLYLLRKMGEEPR